MIIVTFIDIDHYIIPDRFSIGLIIAGLILSPLKLYPLNSFDIYGVLATTRYYTLLNSALGILIAGGIFFIIFWVADLYYSRKGIEAFGFGDVKLAAGIGAILGWKIGVFMLFASFFIGALIAAPIMIIGGKKTKDQIPFAPSICLAGILSFLFGGQIINWYFNLNLLNLY